MLFDDESCGAELQTAGLGHRESHISHPGLPERVDLDSERSDVNARLCQSVTRIALPRGVVVAHTTLPVSQ